MNDYSVLRLVKRTAGEDQTWSVEQVKTNRLFLKVEVYGQDYNFYYATEPENWQTLTENVDGRILSTDIAGGFVGTYIGMYTSSNGEESSNTADFDYFEYSRLS
ncbi:hypothetical protein ACFFHM_23055 [Halalkalibacter kiskunsagensis]|uniref:Beta-xylosidase C-terminal Concanavalin A-like domain-containing protein n=2 Tax=Halalkalibacter kiskunsagensis TaxID=1548599 RepID=A0ABV6KJ02_9BACI